MKKLLLIFAIAILAINAHAQVPPVRINNVSAHPIRVEMIGTGTATTCSGPATLYSYWFMAPVGLHKFFGSCSPLPGFNGCAPTAASVVTWTKMYVEYWPSYSCMGTLLNPSTWPTATGCTPHKGSWMHMATPHICGSGTTGWEKIKLN